jgi:hypothetical protein
MMFINFESILKQAKLENNCMKLERERKKTIV